MACFYSATLAWNPTAVDSRAHDPQLHVHAVIANATQRPDGAWRALRNTELYKQNTLIGAIYNAELRASLEKLGYAVEMTGKHGSFEIAGIERATIEQWSTRHGEIVALAKELGIATPEGLHAIAERTRDAKTEMTRGELAQHWEGLARDRGLDLGPLVDAAREASPQRNVFERVRDWGKALLDRVTQTFGPKPEPLMRDAEPAPRGASLAAAYAVAAGVRHLTERQATFQPYELLRAALNFGSHGARIDGIEARVEALVARGVLLGRNVDGVAHMHVDSKSGLAEAVGRHRGDVPHAQDVVRDALVPKGAERSLDRDKAPELKVELDMGGGGGRQRSFDMGL